ncbi:hypothetical protein VP236O401_P0005 [Vibrio phage 236O40-1]|nr:hypothetical protein VP236O401_P0005 [Vibrio phage 236O40-1]
MKIHDHQLIAAIWHQQLLNLSSGVLFCYVGNQKSLCPERMDWRIAAQTVYRTQQSKLVKLIKTENQICQNHMARRIEWLIESHQIATPTHDKGRGSFYFIDNVMAYEAWLFTRTYWLNLGVTENPQ